MEREWNFLMEWAVIEDEGLEEEGEGAMVMHFEQEPNIRDLRNHPPEMVETLRRLLASGARVEPDPKRPNFYELQHGSEVFYIYLSPATGQILLLATWTNAGSATGQSYRAA